MVACVAIPGTILIVIAFVRSVRSRMKYADRIRAAEARGAFTDMNSLNKTRFRFWALFTLIGVLGMTLSLGVLVLQMVTHFSDRYWVTIAIGSIFGMIGMMAGLLMQREFNRLL